MSDYPSSKVSRRQWLQTSLTALASGTIALSGCRPGADALIVVTNWSSRARAELEAAWSPSQIFWIQPTEGDDPTRLAGLGMVADVVLGGPVAGYRRLEEEGKLQPTEGRPWWLARKTTLGLALAAGLRDSPESWNDLGGPSWAERIGWGDPRRESAALAIAEAHLAEGPWLEAYAELVRAVGQSRDLVGSPLASLSRGLIQVVPTAADQSPEGSGPGFVVWPKLGPMLEGVAVLKGSIRPDEAAQFVHLVADRVEPGEASSRLSDDPDFRSLLADLLGATLVDASAELRAASRRLQAFEHPDAGPAAIWMVQPPPWPPASIQILQKRTDAEVLLSALVDQLTDDPEVRAWLSTSWKHSEHSQAIDGERLQELARAASGRLVAEPRFRAWLRGEWTAWARQRYRRVERLASGWGQPS